MNRETTNKIRFFIEDILPPILRDSGLFRLFAKFAWGPHIDDLADFRERSVFLTDDEYEALYKKHPRVHNQTDNSKVCIQKIIENVEGTSICDVGCGTGYLLDLIRQKNTNLERVTGVDFAIDDASKLDGIEYVAAKVEKLPFNDNEFDTVVCTHVVEHILDYRAAIAELRRITAKKLIIVVPRERESKYSFNPHFNFFPYTHSFLRAMIPVPKHHVCLDISRDIFYAENVEKQMQDSDGAV